MALKGLLLDFGISEIMQLIGHQHKSGALTVRDKDSEVKILFHEGNIVSAAAEPLPEDFHWQGYLVRSGLMTKGQFDLAEKMGRESLQPLELVLLKTKAVSESELKEIIRLRNLDIVNSLFLLNSGEYEFEAGSVSYIAQLTIPINSEQVLMDGYRIKDEWPQVEKTVPSMETRFIKVAGEFSIEERLPLDENKIYKMVDGRRTTGDLVFMSRMGKFEACRILSNLVEKGRIKQLLLAPAWGREPEEKRLAVLQAVFYPVIAVLLLLLLNGVRMNFSHGNEGFSPEDFQARCRVEKIEDALESYRLAYGVYPDSLGELAQKGFISKREINFPLKQEYSRINGGDSYKLGSSARTGE